MNTPDINKDRGRNSWRTPLVRSDRTVGSRQTGYDVCSTLRAKRGGITLVEVIFAIGVVLVGVVGLASVLPVAARRAQDSIDLNEASALASSVFDELQSRKILSRTALAVRLDQPVIANSTTVFNAGNVPLLVNIPVNNPPTTVSNFPPINAWCIDPLFVSSSASARTEANGGYYNVYNAGSGNGYRRMLFPYYREEHNPLIDPSDSSSIPGSNWGASANFAPRMLRVGIARQQGGLLAAREAEAVVESLDEATVKLPEDRTLNLEFQTQKAFGTDSDLGNRLNDGSLTWIATCNVLPGTSFMSVSVVILRNRDRSFYTYPTSLAGPADTPEDNATAERLAYVSYANGFRGGSGGNVHIVAPRNTVSDLTVNDWVMLSRDLPASPAASVHRWFRVAAVDQEPQKITVNDPVHGTAREVWQRKLVLDGPDWAFGFPTPGNADGTVADNTYVTIVEDVVTVSEHTIRLGL